MGGGAIKLRLENGCTFRSLLRAPALSLDNEPPNKTMRQESLVPDWCLICLYKLCLAQGALRAVTVKEKYCFILAVGGAREERAADGCCMYCLLPLGERETLPDQLVARVRRTPVVSINNYRLATCKPTHAVLCTSSGCAREAIKLFKRFQFH